MFHLYGMIVGIAIVVGYSIAERIEPKLSKGATGVIIAGLIGARIYHVIDYMDYYKDHLAQIMYVWNGGLSIWGALMVGAVASIVIYKNEVWGVMRAAVVALPISQAIGRLGNAVNREFVTTVYGVPWWGAEAVLDLVLFGIMYLLYKKDVSPSVMVATYLIGYGFIRYILQPYRA